MADKSGLQGASVAYASLSDSELQYILRENGDDPASVARMPKCSNAAGASSRSAAPTKASVAASDECCSSSGD